MILMHKDDDTQSWFTRLRQFLHLEPQNKDQLIHLLRDAHERALINSDTLAMLEGAMLFAQLQVRDIMLPKQQMTCVHQDDSLSHILKVVNDSGHSRFPVTGSNREEIVGILHAKDLLRVTTSSDEDFDLPDLLRQTTFVPESKRLDTLLSEFRSNRNHMAMVVDEYGAVCGFVTLEDIIEQIVGDIEDEFDIDEEAYIKTHSASHFILKAHTPIEEFNQQLGADFSDDSYDTVGGLIMAKLGHLPKRGDIISLHGFEFKIINADARRIKLLECRDRRHQEASPPA